MILQEGAPDRAPYEGPDHAKFAGWSRLLHRRFPGAAKGSERIADHSQTERPDRGDPKATPCQGRAVFPPEGTIENTSNTHNRRIRHYGLLANRHRREKLALCRKLLDAAAVSQAEDVEPIPQREGCNAVTPTRACPVCGSGRLVVIAELAAAEGVGVGGSESGRGRGFDTS